MENKEELQRQAQEKLSEARRLIDEAGRLAKRGQFYLHFGEIGEFVPSSIDDRSQYREEALRRMKQYGVYRGQKSIPLDQLTPDEFESEIKKGIERVRRDQDVTSDALEYGTRDAWWCPSRCY